MSENDKKNYIISPDGDVFELPSLDLYKNLTDEQIMSNITGIRNIVRLLRMLMEAVHGEEVRGAIHDAILQVYEDATKSDPSNTILEVIIARGEYDTLVERLDAIIERLDALVKIFIQETQPPYTAGALWINPTGKDTTETFTLTLQNSFTIYSNSSANIPTVNRLGNNVHLTGVISPPSGNNLGSTTETTIATLPAGYRPSRAVTTLCRGGNFATWLLKINPNGNVTASRYAQGTAFSTPGNTEYMPFSASWLIDG